MPWRVASEGVFTFGAFGAFGAAFLLFLDAIFFSFSCKLVITCTKLWGRIPGLEPTPYRFREKRLRPLPAWKHEVGHELPRDARETDANDLEFTLDEQEDRAPPL